MEFPYLPRFPTSEDALHAEVAAAKSKRWRVYGWVAILVALVVVAVSGVDVVNVFEVKYTRAKPAAGDLTGRYVTTDGRWYKARLDLFGDGRFTMSGWAGRNGSGRWLCVWDDISSRWDMQLTFLPVRTDEGEHGESGHYLRGTVPPYTIEFFLGDPDNGATLFVKAGPATTPAVPLK